METPKKYIVEDKIDLVQETASTYVTDFKEKLDDSEKLHPILIKLIEQSKRESELGLGISHQEMKRLTKLKYPFLK